MIDVRERATILNVLTKHMAEHEAKRLADELNLALHPPEWEGTETLEDCFSCGGKGHLLIHIDHGNHSSTTYNVLCGRCYGTGKLPHHVQERY